MHLGPFSPQGSRAADDRVHVDLAVADLAAEVARIVGLGVTRPAEREWEGIRWVTLTDPEGNEFDLVAVAG